jgi:hypothetical protein
MIQLDFWQAVIVTSLFILAIVIAAYYFLRDAIAGGIALDRERQEQKRLEDQQGRRK